MRSKNKSHEQKMQARKKKVTKEQDVKRINSPGGGKQEKLRQVRSGT